LYRFNEQLWQLTRQLLGQFARFDEHGYSFTLHANPFQGENIHPGPYRMGKAVEDANTYRVGHPLAQRVIDRGKSLILPLAEVTFQYNGSGKKIAVLESLVGKKGWLTCTQFTVAALETEDVIAFSALTDNADLLDDAQCRRLFDLPAISASVCDIPSTPSLVLGAVQLKRRQAFLDETTNRNGRWFETEIEKLDRWAEDRRTSLKAELDELDDAFKEAKKAARLAPTLPEKLDRQRVARTLETKREETWRAYDEASRDIDRQKDSLLDEVGHRLEQQIEEERLFTLRWHVI
jgi:hypothetical protein